MRRVPELVRQRPSREITSPSSVVSSGPPGSDTSRMSTLIRKLRLTTIFAVVCQRCFSLLGAGRASVKPV